MYIGYDSMPTVYVPVCLSRATVGQLARRMSVFYDNFNAGQGIRLGGTIDTDETVVVFFAKDKDELRRGLASGKDISYRASGPVVLYSGTYDNGGERPSTVKSFGKLLGKNAKAIGSAKGDVVSLKGFSHSITATKLRKQGYFVTVVSQQAIIDANVPVPDTGVSFIANNPFTNKDIASMLNHNRAVKPNTRENDLGSKINWFGMKQRAARKLKNAGVGESIRNFESQQNAPDPGDFDEFDE